MNLSRLTNQELAALIQSAAAELNNRLSEPEIDRIPFRDSRPVVSLREPSEDDKDFILRLKTTALRGGYVSAAERQRVADLAAAGFAEWIKLQGLPLEKGTGPWRKLAEYARVPAARER